MSIIADPINCSLPLKLRQQMYSGANPFVTIFQTQKSKATMGIPNLFSNGLKQQDRNIINFSVIKFKLTRWSLNANKPLVLTYEFTDLLFLMITSSKFTPTRGLKTSLSV